MNEEHSEEQPSEPGPGEILRQARKAANLSTQDIASKIRLKKAMIEDIERDNYDINISLTFIKGYLKLYAKNVQADESAVMHAFENLNTQKKEPAKLQSFSRRFSNQANDDKLMLVTYLILAVVIALVVIWWFQQSSGPVESSSMPEIRSPMASEVAEVTSESSNLLSTTETDVLLQPDDSANSIEQDLMSTVGQISDEQGANVPVNETIENSPDELVATTSELTNEIGESGNVDSKPVELVFEFSGDCWMNLADATGENIAFGVKVKGRTMPVSGIPPFTVTLGAPEVVEISYAGEPVDMSFLTPGRIAKFELPISE